MSSGSGAFFDGLANLLSTLLKGVSQIREITDQKRRRDTIRDLLSACLVADEIVGSGEALLRLAGSDPVRKITEMREEERRPYASECCRLLGDQLRRLRTLSGLLEDAPVIGILDANLKRKLDALIGTKEKGLLAIASPLGIYLLFGPLPEQGEIELYGSDLARMRYQAEILSAMFARGDNDVETHIDLDSAAANLNKLSNASSRLRERVTKLASQEEIVLLAGKAKKRIRRH